MPYLVRVLVVLALIVPSALAAPNVTFHVVPTALPRGTGAGPYSPLLAIDYAELNNEVYTIRVHLLETGSYFCASTNSAMWCNASFTIDNSGGTNASGRIWDARVTNVFDNSGFLWVVDLYNQANVKVSTATQSASSHTNRAPILGVIGNQSVPAGQSLDFTVTSTDAESDAVTYTAYNIPAGATFNSTTGAFHWVPASNGTFTNVAFVVTQTGGTPLSDAEIITITVTNQLDVISVANATTGESGPAVVTVTRSGNLAGTATVNYATANGTATAGTDYTSTSGTLSFAPGETTKTVRVPTTNDATVESNETFTLQLSAPSNATLGTSTGTVTIVDDDTPALTGQWGSLLNWPVVAIHMHLLPTGKVMFWDRHDMVEGWDGMPRLWDPSTNAVTMLPAIDGWDLFCSGHSFLANGKLFVAGGHLGVAIGDDEAGSYNAVSNTWSVAPRMNAGRWYPTSTTLANGDLLVMAGTIGGHGYVNLLPQVWQSETATWRNLTSANFGGGYPLWPDFYPFAYLAPNGKVFVAGPQQTARYLDTSGTGAWTDVAASTLSYRDYGTSVMYDDGKVLIAGGNPREPNEFSMTILPSATAEVIDLGAANPSWRTVAPMTVSRRHHTGVLLPDGKVLVTGGSSLPGLDNAAGAVRYAEVWDPVAETWTPLASHSRYRGYHSNALLLPDARVLVAGGGHPNPAGGFAETNAEIFSPPYLFNGARPVIASAPASVIYGQTFFVQTVDAASIASVTWIRLGSVTHAFDQNQRINRLAFAQTANGLNVTAPAAANLCPPGHYMLFLLNGNGVPSEAKIVRIAATPLELASVAPNAGRSSGGQQVTLTGELAGLSTVTIGGANATWSFTSGTTQISVTTPAHAMGAVPIALTPSSGTGLTTPNAFAYLPTTFTDNILVAAVTTAKAQHILELRNAVDALRLVVGVGAATWTDAVLTTIKAVHITELRLRLEEAAGAAAYTDPALSAGFSIKRLHVEELRARIRDIAGN